jgi:MFS transporter, PPP family, 3-phenylpropionic acid transporter
LFAFNFLIFAGFASASPYMVLYFQGLGFSGAEIGLLAGIAPLITFCGAPFWTGLADATRRHRLILTVSMAVGVAGYILYPFLRAFAAVFLVSIVLNFFFAPVSAFADNATMYMLGEKKDFYGRIRLGGTIGYAIAALVAGVLVGRYGLRAGFWSAAAMYFLGLLLSRGFIHAPSKDSPPALRGLRTLLSNPRWILFLIVSLSSGVALAGVNNYFFPYMKELGAATSIMGIALTIGTITEVPVLFFGHHLLRIFKPYGLFMLAAVVTAVRVLLFAANTSPTLALVIQLLNGFTFPAMWLAGVAWANANAPQGMTATAQGLFGAMTFGFGMAVGGFLGGPLLESLGGRGLYLVFGIIALSTVVVAAVVERSLPKARTLSETGE